MVNKVHQYHGMCKMVGSVTLSLRHNREYLVNYQNILLANSTDSPKYENVSWKIIRDGCVGHKCVDTTIARPTT
jgi:hypothetical protein